MDDIILCSKGEYRSVCMLVRGFPLFADSSGLQVSPSKSEIFCCGMEEDDIGRIKDMSGFSIGKFPFRYLGFQDVLRGFQQGNVNICWIRFQLGSVRTWSTRNFSYAGRVKWIHAISIQEHQWDTYTPPANSSWYWKKVCSVKEKLQNQHVDISGKYSIKKVYQQLIEHGRHFRWQRFIRNRSAVPKHKIIVGSIDAEEKNQVKLID